MHSGCVFTHTRAHENEVACDARDMKGSAANGRGKVLGAGPREVWERREERGS